MSISGFFQFVIGFTLGISIVAGGAVSFGYILLTRMTGTPPKPVYSEETAKPKEDSKEPAIASGASESGTTSNNEASTSQPESTPKEVEKPLPLGAYKAVVSYKDGLSMRSDANKDADRIGSVLVNDEIIVLQESEDKKWQKIRIAKNDKEGWVKAGNIKKIE
jgi:uncharacterized protein YgiM (DUF1202 family)